MFFLSQIEKFKVKKIFHKKISREKSSLKERKFLRFNPEETTLNMFKQSMFSIEQSLK